MQEVFQKIIENLDKASDYYECQEQGREHVRMVDLTDAIEIVKQAVAEYNNGWIPCSERLPDLHRVDMESEGEYYIISDSVIVTDGERICIAEYEIDDGDRVGWSSCECEETEAVIAWQPLPPIYHPKGEREYER